MDANERQLVGYKRKRNEEEEEEEEEEIIMFVVLLVVLSVGRNYMPLTREPYSNHFEYKIRRRQEWLKELLSQPLCVEQLRIKPESFDKLCNILETKGGLVASKQVTIKEIVALFLHILSHCIRNRTIKATYIRSGETISRQFHKVLRAVLVIGSDYIKERPQVLNSRIAENWKWFQGSLGALDGTFIPLTVPAEDECRFRSRKGHISTNVLGVCDANLRFTYVLPGWEGSASDSRVLRDALSRDNGLKVPRNNYYLVDGGYTNGPGFLAPYRSTRYHLNLWRGNTPRNYKELFNHRHSLARSTIERAFGLLKKRWGILRTAGFYDVKTQVRIINACCILHNFIRDESPNDELLNEVDHDLTQVSNYNFDYDSDESDEENITSVRTTQEWSSYRDNLAMEMWQSYGGMH
ncbi:Protein ALP1-like [Linum perenne]